MNRYIGVFFVVLVMVSLGLPTLSYAQEMKLKQRLDPITKTQANKFFESCMEQKYPANTTEAKQHFCACSSARFFNQLRQGDVHDITLGESIAARRGKEKLLQYVYTPCIRDSLADLLREECEMSQYLDDYPYISKRRYCDCQNKRMGLVFREKMGVIAQKNAENIDESISDPISSFMQHPIFVSMSNEITGICMQNATIKIQKRKPLTKFTAPLIIKGHVHDQYCGHIH